MPWLFLVISGIEEVIAAIAMKYVDGTRKNGRLLSWYWGLLCLFLPFESHAGTFSRCCLCRLDRDRQHRHYGSQLILV